MTEGRYDRQVRLAGFGQAAMTALRAATVVVVGAGGLGSPALSYLTGAGAGRIRIIDDDVVSASNLHRQVLYVAEDLGAPKAERAAARLRGLNPEVTAEPRAIRLDAGTIDAALAGAAVVLDCCDNLSTRHLLNRASLQAGIPVVWATIGGWSGRCSVTMPQDGPCFECIFGPPPARTAEPSPCSREAPAVFGPVCGMTGALQAAEALKLIVGAGDLLVGRLASLDARTGDFVVTAVARDPGCQACGRLATHFLSTGEEELRS